MKPDRLEALLWERIDGVISEEDHAELERTLAESGDARELEREIAALAERLSQTAEVPPPSDLRQKIDAALDAARPPGSTGSKVRPGPRPTFPPSTGTWDRHHSQPSTNQPGYRPAKGVTMTENKRGIIGAFVAVAVIGVVAIG